MYCILNREPFLEATRHLREVANKKSTLVATSQLLWRLRGHELTLFATNLEVDARLQLEVEGLEDGELTVPAHAFLDVLSKAMKGYDQVQVRSDDRHRITVKAKGSKSTLSGTSSSGYPKIFAEASIPNGRTIASDDLVNLIDRTFYALDPEGARYALSGTYFEEVVVNGEARLRAVAADGRRLAMAEVPGDALAKRGVTIPRKAVEVLRSIAEDSESVTYHFDEDQNRIWFSASPEVVFSASLVGEKYVPYRELLPKTVQYAVHLPLKETNAALSRLKVVGDATTSVKLEVEVDRVTLTATSYGGREGVETVLCEADEPFEVGFNLVTLAEALHPIESDLATVQFSSLRAPALVKPSEPEGYMALVSPVDIIS